MVEDNKSKQFNADFVFYMKIVPLQEEKKTVYDRERRVTYPVQRQDEIAGSI
jgi:hypothetical protein